jgi:small subunit ribosomal protein S10e
MLVPKKNRTAVYTFLFQEGVMVAKHDFALPKHQDVDVPNLQVINLLKSLTSRGLVRTKFSWNHHYYYLTDEGIDYLRSYLHLPADIIPNTLKKSTRPAAAPRFGGDREGRPERAERGEKSGILCFRPLFSFHNQPQ